MNIRFLGTGAADWQRGGEEFRAFTSTLVGEGLMIDGTPDALGNLPDGCHVTDIAYTHSHRDHFDPALLKRLGPVRAHVHESWAARVNVRGVTVVPFATGETFEAAGLMLTALPANHLTDDPREQPVHFIVSDGARTVLYATYGAWLRCEEWQMLRRVKLDAAIFDATIGEGNPGDFCVFEHNSLEMLRIMVRTLRRPMFGHESAGEEYAPVLRAGAPVYLTHLARTLHPAGEVLERALAGEFVVARDGMDVVI